MTQTRERTETNNSVNINVAELNKDALTLAEAEALTQDYKRKGVTVVEPVPEVPEGLYTGNFQVQERDGKHEPVIRAIDYTNPVNGKPQVFFTAKADLINDNSGKGYNNIGIALNKELMSYLSYPANLAKEQMFRSKKGRVRTFVQLA